MQSGHRNRTQNFEIRWCPNQLGHPRVGLVVPLYGATKVARNRLRRRLREILRRRILTSMPALDLVLRSRAQTYGVGFHDLASELEKWLRSLPESRYCLDEQRGRS
jgi:ribonuclease P protein component